jgi:predicted PurR-regulated permease PerM
MDTKTDFKANKYIFLIIILAFGVLIVFSLSEYFTAFLGSVLFYVLFKSWMESLVTKNKWKKSFAAILIIVVSFFIVLLPITLFFSMAYNKVVPIASNPNTFLPYVHQVDSTLKHNFNIEILTDENIDVIKSASAKVVSGALNQGIEFFSSIVMMYFFLYFMLVNFNRMEAFLIYVLPFQKSKIEMFAEELKAQTFSNAIGIPLIAFVQGLFAYIIYLIAGVPDTGFWAILTGFASVIPIVGAGIIWGPVCIYLFFIGANWQGVIVALWSILIMGSMDNVIRFLLAKKMADVHPVITVLGIIIGLKYLGVTGLIFGPLIISYFIILLKIYYSDFQNTSVKSKPKQPMLEIGLPFIFTKKFSSKSGEKK